MSKIPEPLQNIDLQRTLRRNGVLKYKKQQEDLYTAARMVAKKFVSLRKAHSYQFTEAQKQDYATRRIHIVDTFEKRFKEAIGKYLNHLEDKVLANLHKLEKANKKITAKNKADLYDVDNEVQAGINLFDPIMKDLDAKTAELANKLLGSQKPYTPTLEHGELIDRRVANFTGSIALTDRERLTHIIEDGYKQGTSVPELRNEIMNTFSDYSKTQADRVARTELLYTSNQAQLEVYQQSGFVNQIEWVLDGNPCPECEDAASNSPQDIEGGAFAEASDWFSGDCPPLHPNCECTIVPVIDDTAFSDGNVFAGPDDDLGLGDIGGIGSSMDESQFNEEGPGVGATPESGNVGTLFHGEGGDKLGMANATSAFGDEDITYFSRTPGVAAEHGEVTAYAPKNIKMNDIYVIHNQAEYDEFFKRVATSYPGEDFRTAAPKWLEKFGFKGGEITEADDPNAGLGLLNKYIKDFKKFSLPAQLKEYKEYIAELEKLLGVSDE